MKTGFKICIKDADIKIRKLQPPVGKPYRDKTKYTRKLKHKKEW